MCKHLAGKGASQTTNQPPTIKLQFPHSPNLEHWEEFSMILGKTVSQRNHSLLRISAHEESGDHLLRSLICRDSSRILTDNDETSKPGSTAEEDLSWINAHALCARGAHPTQPANSPENPGGLKLAPSQVRTSPSCLGDLCIHLPVWRHTRPPVSIFELKTHSSCVKLMFLSLVFTYLLEDFDLWLPWVSYMLIYINV